MKKSYLVSLMVCLLAIVSAVGQTTQKGFVKEYKETLKKQPLGGVEMLITNAPSTVSDKKGGFALEFQTMKPGQKVNVRRIEKLGYEIFNKEALEQWNINPEEPFTIIMVRSDRFKKIRDNYSAVSSASYARQFEKEMKALEEERNAGKITEEQLRNEIIRLQEEYDRQLNNLDNYIDRFARIDLSELNKNEQEIIALVQAGKIEEAIQYYDRLNLITKWKNGKKDIDNLLTAQERIEKTIVKKNSDIQNVQFALLRQIQTLQLAGGRDNFHKAGSLLKQMALTDSTDITFSREYAKFAHTQQLLDEAINFYERCIAIGDYKEQLKAKSEIGLIYLESNDFEQARDYLSSVKSQCTYIDDKITKDDILASINIGLGNLYSQTGNFQEAITSYSEVIEAQRSDLNDSQSLNEKSAIAYVGLGNAYANLNKAEAAIPMYNLALECFMRNANAHQKEIGLCHCNLGGLYSDNLNDFENAVLQYNKALSIFEQLATYNPDAYTPDLAFTLSNMGAMYLHFQDFDKSELYCSKAMNLYHLLSTKNPRRFLADLLHVSTTKASVYSSTGRFSEAEKLFKDITESINTLPSAHLEFYRPAIWLAYINMGILYIQMQDYEKANAQFMQTMEHSKIICSHTHNPYHIWRNIELQVFCDIQLQKFDDALSRIDTIISLVPSVPRHYDTKGEILLLINKDDEAKQMWDKVMELDPHFLETHQSNLYEQLKAKGLIE